MKYLQQNHNNDNNNNNNAYNRIETREHDSRHKAHKI